MKDKSSNKNSQKTYTRQLREEEIYRDNLCIYIDNTVNRSVQYHKERQ